MSKTLAIAITGLAFCLGIVVGMSVMSSQAEKHKKQMKQAEAALKEVEKNAEKSAQQARLRVESARQWSTQKELSLKTELNKAKYAKDQLSREVAVLEENLSKITKAETVEKSQLQKNNATVAEKEQWKEVASWSGKGAKSTETFHISSRSWRVSWTTRPTKWSGNSNFQIYVYTSDGSLYSVAANVIGEDKNSSVIHGSGDFYFTFNTDQHYVVVVETK